MPTPRLSSRGTISCVGQAVSCLNVALSVIVTAVASSISAGSSVMWLKLLGVVSVTERSSMPCFMPAEKPVRNVFDMDARWQAITTKMSVQKRLSLFFIVVPVFVPPRPAALSWRASGLGRVVLLESVLSNIDYYLSFFDMQRYGKYLYAPNFFNKYLSKNDNLTSVCILAALQKAANRTPKGRLLHAKRRPFVLQFTAFCNTLGVSLLGSSGRPGLSDLSRPMGLMGLRSPIMPVNGGSGCGCER